MKHRNEAISVRLSNGAYWLKSNAFGKSILKWALKSFTSNSAVGVSTMA
ncbi:hypothetical protein ACFQ4C_07055 [Larkinella insperata]|uniref:Uncharacterized protein n=1 Tax=Larkinella insperata TaxID=332158 RepID=A0ABW3Q398_9BACT